MITLPVILASVALARPRAGPAPSIDGGQPLIAALKNAGWVATPEGSDRYQPGNIYSDGHGLWASRSQCFTAVPVESLYNELEVSMALKAGARVPLGLVTASAAGVRYKKLTYADPRVSELEGRALKLSAECAADLREVAAGQDLSSWYVVQAVLLAVVNQQECTTVDAGVQAGGVGVSAAISESCAMSSEGVVAVAYKTVPVTRLLGGSAPLLPAQPLAAGTLSSPTPAVEPPRPPSSPVTIPDLVSAPPALLAVKDGEVRSVDPQTGHTSLMAAVLFGEDVLVCRHCRGPLTLRAVVVHPPATTRILDGLARARPPPMFTGA